MNKKSIFKKAFQAALFFFFMYLVIHITIIFGVKEKSWFQKSWEFLLGGGVGAIAGAAFFLLFGTIGWVCGPLYGAIGLVLLVTGGALGGLGLGAIINIIRNPSDFIFYPYKIFFILTIGGLLSWHISIFVANIFLKKEYIQ